MEEHLYYKQDVEGSIPSRITIFTESSSVWFRALGLGPRGRRFKSCLSDHAGIAQFGEQLHRKEKVVGSIPVSGTIKDCIRLKYISNHHTFMV